MGGDTVWKAQCVESDTDEQIWEITTAAPTHRNPYNAALNEWHTSNNGDRQVLSYPEGPVSPTVHSSVHTLQSQ